MFRLMHRVYARAGVSDCKRRKDTLVTLQHLGETYNAIWKYIIDSFPTTPLKSTGAVAASPAISVWYRLMSREVYPAELFVSPK